MASENFAFFPITYYETIDWEFINFNLNCIFISSFTVSFSTDPSRKIWYPASTKIILQMVYIWPVYP